MSYKIKTEQITAATKLGVKIKPSTRKGKKIDVFIGTQKVASIGALGYGDYWTYFANDPQLATKKRKAYQARHQGEQLKKDSPGYYAWFILW